MLLKKLQNDGCEDGHRRCPTAEKKSNCKIKKHRLRFWKKSRDGSGKCYIEYTGNDEDVVYGVLFYIDEIDHGYLSKEEGATSKNSGYKEKKVSVITDDGEEQAFTYTINGEDKIDKTRKPYSWYKKQVVQGAIENGLPEDYIKKIEAFESIQDMNEKRRTRNENYLS
ncbi:uncharacterized protein METZ01_LOCUS383980 [marine metagenome]|uniref:Gamma-glutamylcyclotransferase AIG2-like domain-containing protein n=1 Tax=marine metagenome TaxID=408172 RepID=A0A382UA13_9ZZZZ